MQIARGRGGPTTNTDCPFSPFSSSCRAYLPPSDGFLVRLKISATARRHNSFKMQMVALIFALSTPFPFRTRLPAIGAKRAVHATARLLRTRVHVRVHTKRRRGGGRKRERERERTLGLNRVNFNCTSLMLSGQTVWSCLKPDCRRILAPWDGFVTLSPCILNYSQKITNRCTRDIISDSGLCV